ncbi:MAG: hypothetical protein AB7D30_11670, partial [Lysobacteraceae bacterium]
VREQKAAEKAGARPGGSGSGSRQRRERGAGSGPRPGGERGERPPRAEGSRSRSRPPRPHEDEASAPAQAQGNGAAAPEPGSIRAGEQVASSEATEAKKRRRCGGRRQREARERVEARLLHGDRVAPADKQPAPATPANGSPESLLARLKKRVGRFFNRPPARH